ncbi:acyl-CoA reductase [Rhodopseudomonas palustris]|uniref:acyl-CoA reductase n=1 Tax=Rhodopseudomonas palustris TaxID=1076 RepID=UPI0021F2CE97|nr:acyl-CoA reductase [Rhodopseudomonas palustris]UYO53630.1 acyl-CoA reductase [Rhodopseudomonas palustris]
MPIIDAQSFETGQWRAGFEFGGAAAFADDGIQQFLNALSRAILADKEARGHPDLATFGYFCRKANLARAIADLPSASSRFGWGTLVHIAPSNIPLNFAFSLVIGLLAGNSNIVRLPSRHFAQTGLCVTLIDRVLADPNFATIARRTRFVQTGRDSAVLDELISQAQGLVVWGGDSTVRRFRALPKSPRCVEVYFPDRVSSLLVDAACYLAMSEDDARLNARRFFNDTFLVDQNACSSPTTVFWLGDQADITRAQERFWSLLAPILGAEYSIDPVARINRDLDIFRDVITVGHALKLTTEYDIWRLDDPDVLGLPLRFGTFLELPVTQVAQVLDFLRPNEQTLTTLGVAPEEVFRGLTVDGRIPGVDRIVPVGGALDIAFNWDGKELLSILSRRVQTS